MLIRASSHLSSAFAAGLTATAQNKKSALLLHCSTQETRVARFESISAVQRFVKRSSKSPNRVQAFKASAETRLTIERDKEKVSFLIRPVLEFSRFFEPVSHEIGQESGPNKTKARITFKEREERRGLRERQRDRRAPN